MRSCYFRHGRLARPVRRYGFRSREPDDVGVVSHPLFEGGDTKRSINARQPATTQNGPLAEPAQQATTPPSLPFLRRSVTDDLFDARRKAGAGQRWTGQSNTRFRSGTIRSAVLVRAVLCTTPIKQPDHADGYREQRHQACENNGNADTPRYFCHNEGRKTDEDLKQHYGRLRAPSARSHAFSAASASLRSAAAD